MGLVNAEQIALRHTIDEIILESGAQPVVKLRKLRWHGTPSRQLRAGMQSCGDSMAADIRFVLHELV
jgi:hypothetical protein